MFQIVYQFVYEAWPGLAASNLLMDISLLTLPHFLSVESKKKKFLLWEIKLEFWVFGLEKHSRTMWS